MRVERGIIKAEAKRRERDACNAIVLFLIFPYVVNRIGTRNRLFIAYYIDRYIHIYLSTCEFRMTFFGYNL